MLFSKTIKLLLCLVIIMPYLVQAPQASASVNYDHNALLEYEGYGQAMYDTIVDQTTFVTGQYTDNKQYVKDSYSQIKDYANFWLNEQGNLKNACGGLQIFSKNCLGELTSSAGGYALTVGDFIKNLFNDYETELLESEPPYLSEFYTVTYPGTVKYTAKNGYAFKFTNHNIQSVIVGFSASSERIRIYYDNGSSDYLNARADEALLSRARSLVDNQRATFTDLSSIMNSLGYGITLVSTQNGLPPESSEQLNSDFSRINNYIKDNGIPNIVTPQPKAYLSCPDGTRIDMAINGSTFLDKNGQVMTVNKNGTAQVSSQICNLGWEKQKVDYVDDKAAITDPDGNWLDIVSGDLLECVLLEKCEVSKPPTEIEPIDNSLVEYVKNAYEYATGVLKTATDGLKSLGNGAKELTALFGVFFSWLPREMVVLMSSGLGIMIGLRLFRK